MTTALFIGRFQPLHRGHHHAITAAADAYDLTIGIGSAAAGYTRENPLTFGERVQQFRTCFPGLPVIGIPDRGDDGAWTDDVETVFNGDTVISGNALVRELLGGRGWEVVAPEALEPDTYAGTTIRDLVRDGEEWRDRVPDCVIPVLDDIGFAERVRSE